MVRRLGVNVVMTSISRCGLLTTSIRTNRCRGAATLKQSTRGCFVRARGNGTRVFSLLYNIKGMGTTTNTVCLVSHNYGMVVGCKLSNNMSNVMHNRVYLPSHFLRRSFGLAVVNCGPYRGPTRSVCVCRTSTALLGLTRGIVGGAGHNATMANSDFVYSSGIQIGLTGRFGTEYYSVRATTVTCDYCTVGIPFLTVHYISSSTKGSTGSTCLRVGASSGAVLCSCIGSMVGSTFWLLGGRFSAGFYRFFGVCCGLCRGLLVFCRGCNGGG